MLREAGEGGREAEQTSKRERERVCVSSQLFCSSLLLFLRGSAGSNCTVFQASGGGGRQVSGSAVAQGSVRDQARRGFG